jgi:aminomethyltransferase
MVPFAGYELPVQYPAGVLASHLHTRAAGASPWDLFMRRLNMRFRWSRDVDAFPRAVAD